MLTKKIVGIDISDSSIKIVESRAKGKSLDVLSYNYSKIKKGVIENGIIKDEKSLVIIIQEMLEKASPSAIKSDNICLGIPDYQVFSYCEEGMKSTKADLKEAVKKIAHKNIPVDKNDLLFSYVILKKEVEKKGHGHFDILISGTYREVVTMWNNFFEKLNLNLVSLMSNTNAACFAMNMPANDTVCLVDIGDRYTNINICKNKNAVFSHTINNAGHLITKNISKSKNSADNHEMPWGEAEEIKMNYKGVEDEDSDQAIVLLINNTIRSISTEVHSIIKMNAENKNICATSIELLGGSSKISDLNKNVQEYFNTNAVSFNCSSDLPDKQSEEKTKEAVSLDESAEEVKETEETEESKVEEVIEPVAEVQKNEPKVIISSLATSSFLGTKIDSIFLQSVGLTFAGIHNTDLLFTKDKIKTLIKDNEQTKKKQEDKEEAEKKASDNSQSWVKANQKKVQLIALLVIFIIMMPLAYWFRSGNAKKKTQEAQVGGQYSVPVDIDLIAVVTTKAGEADKNTIRSRMTTITIDDNSDYTVAKNIALESAKVKIKKQEKVWAEPINAPIDTESIIFPLDFEFLLYNENDISAFVIHEGQERYGMQEFILSGLQVKSLNFDNEIEKYLFTISTSYLLNPGITDKKTASSTMENSIIEDSNNDDKSEVDEQEAVVIEEATEEVDQAEDEDFDVNFLEQLLKNASKNKFDNYATVLDSGVGWLNVRSGPGTNHEIVDRIFTGEIYELINEQAGWTSIAIEGHDEVWVSSSYVEVTKK